MASLRQIAQDVLYEARDGIAWIALYKEGRSWGAECFWADQNRDYTFTFTPDDAKRLREILAIDENAIFVNPYYCNLGPTAEEGMTRATLADGLRWQYNNSYFPLDEALESASVESEPDNPAEQETSADTLSIAKPASGALKTVCRTSVNRMRNRLAAVLRIAAKFPIWDTTKDRRLTSVNPSQERSG